jgi:hypothetical protein
MNPFMSPFTGMGISPFTGMGMGWPGLGWNPFMGPFTGMGPFMGMGVSPSAAWGWGPSMGIGWGSSAAAPPPWGAGTATSPNVAWNPTTGMSPSMGPAAPLRPGILAGGSPMEIPLDASPLVSAFISYTQNRTADIAGWEDHSILTRGVGNLNTYDDSNVFIDRTGKINANTGDLDSAGLNAVATVRSTVSAGPHCDDGCDNESVITSQLGAFDEADVAIDGAGNVVMPDIFDSDNIGTPTGAGLVAGGRVINAATDRIVDPDGNIVTPDNLPAGALPPGAAIDAAGNIYLPDANDDDPGDSDGVPAGLLGDGAIVGAGTEGDDSVDDDDEDGGADTEEDGAEAILPPDGSLTVGGDGIDDLSARVDGAGNINTYDDSNVVIGGTGDVNAQIGDSDTGGTAAMDTVDSVAHAGNSR